MRNTIEQKWKELLYECIHNGFEAEKDDAKILEIFGNNTFIKNPLSNMVYLGADIYLNMIKKGKFDIDSYPLKSDALYDYVSSFTNEKSINGNGFVYTYPERLWNHNEKTNQIQTIINRLTENIGSNRAVATTLIPSKDENETDIPCLQTLQGVIRDNQLTLSVFFRSNDLYGAFPSNMMFLTYIGLYLTDTLRKIYPELQFNGIDYHSSSLHIYETDLDMARKVIQN